MTDTGNRRLADISDVLGPADKRFFGSTFRSTRQRMDLVVEESTSTSGTYTIDGDARISYTEGGWAGEQSVSRTPHLSSLDSVMLSARIASEVEGPMRRQGILGDEESLCLRGVSLRAGSESDQATESVPVHGAAEVAGDAGGPVRASASLKIGQMKVDLLMGSVEKASESGEVHSSEMLLSNVPQLRLVDVELNSSSQVAECLVTYPATDRWCDAFVYVAGIVVQGQLIQALLSDIDSISRNASGNLWLRSFDGAWDPSNETQTGERARVELRKHRHLDLRGGLWSASEWQCSTLGVQSKVSVAYDITGTNAGDA